jgi:hypothetical protein
VLPGTCGSDVRFPASDENATHRVPPRHPWLVGALPRPRNGTVVLSASPGIPPVERETSFASADPQSTSSENSEVSG